MDRPNHPIDQRLQATPSAPPLRSADPRLDHVPTHRSGWDNPWLDAASPLLDALVMDRQPPPHGPWVHEILSACRASLTTQGACPDVLNTVMAAMQTWVAWRLHAMQPSHPGWPIARTAADDEHEALRTLAATYPAPSGALPHPAPLVYVLLHLGLSDAYQAAGCSADTLVDTMEQWANITTSFWAPAPVAPACLPLPAPRRPSDHTSRRRAYLATLIAALIGAGAWCASAGWVTWAVAQTLHQPLQSAYHTTWATVNLHAER